jgi:hypothetical protein
MTSPALASATAREMEASGAEALPLLESAPLTSTKISAAAGLGFGFGVGPSTTGASSRSGSVISSSMSLMFPEASLELSEFPQLLQYLFDKRQKSYLAISFPYCNYS